MRVVVDTNVLVSAALKRNSTPALAVRHAQDECVLLKSTATEHQLFDVLGRPYFQSLVDDETRDWLIALMAGAECVDVVKRIVACRDPTDDKFLEVAANGCADMIVSGDKDLLELNPFRGIPVVTPAMFVNTTRMC